MFHPTLVTRSESLWIRSTLPAAFEPRPELRGSPAALLLCVHRGFRGQEPLEDLHVALSGCEVERSIASGRTRREAFEWSKSGRELPGLCPIFSWRILGENTSEDPTSDLSAYATNIHPSTPYTFEICHIQALYQFFSFFPSDCSLGVIMTCFAFKIRETQVLSQFFSLIQFKHLGDLSFW